MRNYILFILIISTITLYGKVNNVEDTIRFKRQASFSKDDHRAVLEFNLMDDVIPHVKTKMKIPIYEFKKNNTGIFINRLSDTIAKYDYMSCRILYTVTHDSMEYSILASKYITPTIISKIKGVIIQNDNKIIAILNNDPKWINKMGLQTTGHNANILIHYNVPYVLEGDDNEYSCIMHVLPCGKVDIYNLRFNGNEISNYPPKKQHFNWIRQFYIKHGYTSGCKYLDTF